MAVVSDKLEMRVRVRARRFIVGVQNVQVVLDVRERYFGVEH